MAPNTKQFSMERLAKIIVSGGARFAFNDKLPLPFLRWAINQIPYLEGGDKTCELSEGAIDGIPYDFWTPKKLKPGRVLLYSHGGAYTMFSHRTHRSLVSRLAREFKAQAIAHDYRLSPEHQFPAAIEDTLRIYQHLLRLGYNPKNIIFAGDSAGGGITFALLLALRDRDLPLPALAIGISPWVDLTMSGKSIEKNAASDNMLSLEGLKKFAIRYVKNPEDIRHPYVSPLFADLSGLPPIFLQAAEDEILRDDAIRMEAALKKANVPVTLDVWPGLFHVFEFAWRYLPQSEAAIVRMGDFVRTRLGA